MTIIHIHTDADGCEYWCLPCLRRCTLIYGGMYRASKHRHMLRKTVAHNHPEQKHWYIFHCCQGCFNEIRPLLRDGRRNGAIVSFSYLPGTSDRLQSGRQIK